MLSARRGLLQLVFHSLLIGSCLLTDRAGKYLSHPHFIGGTLQRVPGAKGVDYDMMSVSAI